MTESDRLERIEERLTSLEKTDQRIEQTLAKLVQENREVNLRVETYQKASQQVVNLAFSLIVTAGAAIIIPAIISAR